MLNKYEMEKCDFNAVASLRGFPLLPFTFSRALEENFTIVVSLQHIFPKSLLYLILWIYVFVLFYFHTRAVHLRKRG